MKRRIISNPLNLKFEPFDNYGKSIKGMSWHKISYEKEKGQGSYILKMEPGAKSIPHEHDSYEEFYMIDGSQLAPSNFAEDVGGTWTAIKYEGTFGTAGFHLDFADSSDLGNDVSGNGEHFNEVNIVSGNQITSNLPPFKA